MWADLFNLSKLLDSKLIWEKQVDMVCNKLTQQKYII